MKNYFYDKKRALFALSILMMLPLMAFAQEEVIVEEGLETLTAAITANPGKTLVLKRGELYVTTVTANITVPTIIKSQETPADLAPAIIQMDADPSQGKNQIMFKMAANFTLQGVGLIGATLGDEQIKTMVENTAVNTELIVDGCNIQSVNKPFNAGGQVGFKVTLKNNIVYNLAIVGWENYGGYLFIGGGPDTDFQMYNNTIVVGSRIMTILLGGPEGRRFVDHNSFILTFGDTNYPQVAADLIYTNNLFYDAHMRGYVGEIIKADTVYYKGDFVDYEYDDISGNFCVMPHLRDSVGVPRTVDINNNLHMYSPFVLDFYAAHPEITPQTFDSQHGKFFAERYGWNVKDNMLQEEDNAIDPQFENGLPESAYKVFFDTRIERNKPVADRGEGFPYELAWRPGDEPRGEFIWPLPFNLKPTNTELWKAGSDGYPIGDLSWFGPEVVAAYEAGLENPISFVNVNKFAVNNSLKLESYPNPFRNSTTISYNVPAQSNVKVSVYNSIGERVAFLVNEIQTAGQHEMEWNAEGKTHGLYFVKVEAGNYSQVRKVALMK